MRKMFILRGLPGSGKSTVAEVLAADPTNSVICSADHYFLGKDGVYRFDGGKLHEAHDSCFYAAKQAVEGKVSVVVIDNTNSKKWEFQKYLELGDQHGYMVSVLVVENHHNGKNLHGVPVKVLEKMRDRFEISL